LRNFPTQTLSDDRLIVKFKELSEAFTFAQLPPDQILDGLAENPHYPAIMYLLLKRGLRVPVCLDPASENFVFFQLKLAKKRSKTQPKNARVNLAFHIMASFADTNMVWFLSVDC
jgi:hypothetical protein